ncbi:MAG TPA: aldo/keto reductase [Dehalococcoidia bacterium]|nr:aldo/keto reductase [Dehalococcoidia bacterium]
MKYRRLGTTDLEVSEVGFGVWTLTTGWWGEHGEDEVVRMLRQAFDLGINFFDTADVYGDGRGETVLAKALGPVRDRCVYATKIGYNWYDHKSNGQRERPQDFSPAFMRRAVEGCLERLGTDRIDWLQLHNPRLATLQRDEVFETLAELQREGKVRWWGAALGPAIGWRDEGLYAIRERRAPALQVIHNLLEQEPGRDFLEAAAETGCGLVIRVPHSSGLLEGRYTENTTFPPSDHRSHRPRSWLIDGLKKVEQLRFLEIEGRRTLGQAAIQWLLHYPSIASVLPNIYDEDQLREFAAASESPPLTQEEFDRVQALYAAHFGLTPEVVS